MNSIFHNQLEKNQHQDKSHTVYERHIYIFSDCSYIIYDYKEGVDELRKDIQNLIILQDRDNCYYFNYLCSVKQRHDYYRGKELLQRLRKLIENEVRIQQNNPIKAEAQKILEKYQWLPNYLDESMPFQNTESTVMYCNFQ